MAKIIKSREEVRMVLYMPNQLLSMDLTGLDRFQIESLEVMFYNTQNELKFGNTIEFNGFNKRIYRIKAEDLFENLTDISSRIGINTLAKKLEKLTSISANTFDKHSIGSFSLFPSVVYILEDNVLVYTLADELETSFNNGNTVISPKNEKESNKKYFTPMDLIKIKNMKLSDYTRNFFRSSSSSFTFMDSHDFVELDYTITEFRAVTSIGSKYKRYSDLKEYVLDKISEELKEHGIIVEFSNKTFRKQTTHIIAKFIITEEFINLCNNMRKMANSKDKPEKEKKTTVPKEVNSTKKLEDKTENVEVKIKSQQEFADELKMRNSNIEYVHYEKDGAEFKLNEIINCSNKEGIIKLILETEDYQVYYQKFSNNVEQKYENNIVTEVNFKKGYKFRKIKEEEKIIF